MLIRSAGGGKSLTTFGPRCLLCTILERLPPVCIALGERAFPSQVRVKGSTTATAAIDMESSIKAEDIAHKESSQVHVVVHFEEKWNR